MVSYNLSKKEEDALHSLLQVLVIHNGKIYSQEDGRTIIWNIKDLEETLANIVNNSLKEN